MIIESVLIGFGLVLWYMGWTWEKNLRRPPLKKPPLVSILIPAYKSEDHIEATVKSAKALDYPKKEILVVNDSDDRTPEICKSLGVKCIQNSSRRGKGHALNELAKKAKGEILFFLDSDTSVAPDVLKKLVPWFSKPKVAAVSPRWVVKNSKHNLVTRMLTIENKFNHNFFKTHMFFGSMIAFRGCGIAMRADIFRKMGGWPDTLIEDADMSAHLVGKGYIIQYEPSAVIMTNEPESYSALGRQRFRWGKGSLFSFLNHRSTYKASAQFIIYFIPYILMALAIVAFFAIQAAAALIPFMPYLAYLSSMRDILLTLTLLFIPLITSMMASVIAASIGHVAIMSRPEKKGEKRELILLPLYILYFLPFLIYSYMRGVVSGIKDYRKKRGQLNLRDW